MARQEPVTWDYRLVRVTYEAEGDSLTLMEVRVVQYNRESGSVYAIGDDPVMLQDVNTAGIRNDIQLALEAFNKDILDHEEEIYREGYGVLDDEELTD